MHPMTTMQAFSWPDAVGVTALTLSAVAIIGFAVAGFVQLRTARIKAGQDDDLRQLVRRYERLAETTLDAQQRAVSDLADVKSRTTSIEQILRTVE